MKYEIRIEYWQNKVTDKILLQQGVKHIRVLTRSYWINNRRVPKSAFTSVCPKTLLEYIKEEAV
jgi:hypothetical protein